MEINPEEIKEKFEDNFWQGYSIMQGNFLKNKKYFSQFFFVFFQLSKIHETYSESLSHLCSFFDKPKDKDSSSPFNQVIISFIDQLKEESNQHRLLSEEAKQIAEENIAMTLNNIGKLFSKEPIDLIINNNTTTNNIITQEDENETTIFNSLNKFKTLENKFKDMSNECNQCKTSYFNELTTTLNEHFQRHNFMQYVLNGIENEEFNNKEILNKQQIYISQINETNNIIKEYVLAFKHHAQIFQNIDLTYMSTIKNSILKYSQKKKEQTNMSIEFLETKVQNVLDKLNIYEVQCLFIENNRTFGFPPEDLAFVNYSVNFKNFNLPKEDNNNQVTTNTRKLLQLIQKFIVTFIEKPKLNQDIPTLFDALVKEEMTEKEFDLIQKKLKNNIYSLDNALVFLELLNNSRAVKCDFTKKYFFYLADLLCLIHEASQQDNIEFLVKYKCINFLIILGQTFYMQSEINQQEKIYLFDEMIQRDVFKNVNWFELFKYVFYDNVKSSLKYKEDYKFELNQQDQEVMKTVIQPKIVGVIQNMVFLKQSNENIDNVIEKLCKYYNEDKEYLMMMKQEFIKSNENDNENDNENKE